MLQATADAVLARSKSAAADIRRNVVLTTQMVREYITEHVETKLAFDIPTSWHLFMLGASDEKSEDAMKRKKLTDKQAAYEEALRGLALSVPSDQESAYLSSQHVQHSRGEDKDAIAKCESGFGAALRGGVWGAEWVAYGAKYALVHSYGLVDKTVASGGCRHDTSPGFDKRQQTRKGWLEYKQIPPLGFKAATHSTGRQVHQDPIKRTTMPEQQDQATESLIKARS
ncbi:hypothetical protein WJX79_000362 [Trebouxia sp. C0005]